MLHAIGLLLAALVTAAAIAELRHRARRWGLVDHPDARKHHAAATPLVGGIGMFMGLIVGATLLASGPTTGWLIAAGGIVVIVGVADDRLELGSTLRLAAQTAAGLVMTLGAGVTLANLGHLGAPDEIMWLGGWSVPLTVFATVGVINALNMSDGMDGLAGTLTLVAAGALALAAALGGHAQSAWTLGLLMAVVAAFLFFNLRARGPALVFMGDAGSMLLGLVLAWFAVALTQGEDRAIAPVTALWILAVPLIDTVSLIVRRLLRRRSPFSADRWHLHHLLRDRLGPRRALGFEALLAVATAGMGLAADYAGVSEALMFWLFIGVFTGYTLFGWFWAGHSAPQPDAAD
ncbi:MAG: undecaprenyl/decaprenyl-phosphate alpha-N-acetylglucosaminyl 1-phosphate transferase [Chromatiales bacterium]|nr:undecaprenyl/decaprenyl-phosphate alpha-N-acetylglucosaminyl 1-phosphate transferase [Chromatiales bacterium]